MTAMLIVTNVNDEITRVNEATARVLGFKANELVGQSVEIIFADGLPKELAEANERGTLDNFETRFLTNDARIVLVVLSSNVTPNGDVVYSAQDVSALRKVEETVDAMGVQLQGRSRQLANLYGVMQMTLDQLKDVADRGADRTEIQYYIEVLQKAFKDIDISNLSKD